MVGIRRLWRRSRLTDCGRTLPSIRRSPLPFVPAHGFPGRRYEGRRRMIVLCHEAGHVRHRHSAERIAVELVRSSLVQSVRLDCRAVVAGGARMGRPTATCSTPVTTLPEYRTVIFHQLGHNPDIACGLNHSLTKNDRHDDPIIQKTPFRRAVARCRHSRGGSNDDALQFNCQNSSSGSRGPDRPTVTVHISPAERFSSTAVLCDGRGIWSG